MKLSIKAGATSQSVNLFVQDSSSTTGAGLGAVAPAGGSLLTGTKLYYSFTGASAGSVSVTLSVLATVGAAYSSGGIVTIDDTNMKGWVRVDLPNAMIAAGNGRVVSGHLFGGTNMAPCPFEIELTGWDNQDGVHGGMTALPNAAANATGGLQASVIRGGTAQAGAAGSITLDSGASATNNLYQDLIVTIVGGTGIGQSRSIQGYTGSSKVATIFPNWTTNPDSTSVFILTPAGQADVGNWLNGTIPAVNVTGVPLVDAKYLLGTIFATPATAGTMDVNAKNINNVSTSSVTTINANQGTTQPVNFDGTGGTAYVKSDVEHWITVAPNALAQGKVDSTDNVRNGTAQSGAAGTITLDAGASATDQFYRGLKISIVSGTGANQGSRLIGGYTGSTKVASVVPNWTTTPDATSVFVLSTWCGTDVELWELVTPNGLVSGRLDASVGAMAANVITASAINAAAMNGKGDWLVSSSYPTNFGSLSITGAGLVAITSNVKKNAAISNFPFLMTDSTTHAPKSGLGSAVTVTRSIDGAAFGAGSLGAVSEIANGWYQCSFAAADTNGNFIGFRATATNADDLDLQFPTQP